VDKSTLRSAIIGEKNRRFNWRYYLSPIIADYRRLKY